MWMNDLILRGSEAVLNLEIQFPGSDWADLLLPCKAICNDAKNMPALRDSLTRNGDLIKLIVFYQIEITWKLHGLPERAGRSARQSKFSYLIRIYRGRGEYERMEMEVE
jgi:hypothetical protein